MKYTVAFVMLTLMMQACYYDNVEELYPVPPSCDTTNVTYSNTVWPIINENCTSCHSGSAPSGNVSLSNYNEIYLAAESGLLMGTIRHEDGYSPMPKGGGKLSDCNISQLEIWIDDGAPDNK